MSIGFDPVVPVVLIWTLACAAVAVMMFAFWRGLSGWLLRGAALLIMVLVLAAPQWQKAVRQALADIVILVEDRSDSQSIGPRSRQMDEAMDALNADLAAQPATVLRRVTVDQDVDGTLLAGALSRALDAEPQGRVAGLVILSDGRLHDASQLPAELDAPVHVLLTGRHEDWDRRLVIEKSPGYGLMGQEVEVILRVEDQGRVPDDVAAQPARLSISVNGEDERTTLVPVGVSLAVPVTPANAGENIIAFRLEVPDAAPPQLTTQNDAAALSLLGLRDRLQVLLVSGEPHPGLRSWRNLLKSDPSVDLVHFTILRTPDKFDGVPADEMALIAFPTQELFTRRLKDFDLVIFDRYSVRGILPPRYFGLMRDYVEKGGAILISSGPEAASVESLGFTDLGKILPAPAAGAIINEAFLPELTELGRKHPVTAGLTGAGAPGKAPEWGRWMGMSVARPRDGVQTVLEADGNPLLLLDRVGKGRIAQLMSDHIWLWGRGFEGGGPQQELLRRLAHWSMGEPELEEEFLETRLTPDAGGRNKLQIIRRSLLDDPGTVTITNPDGESSEVIMRRTAAGRFVGEASGLDEGLYRLEQGGLTRMVSVGPASPREFEETVASGDLLQPLVSATGGGIFHLADGLPSIRQVRPGTKAHGGNWLGLTPRGATSITSQSAYPLLPAWLGLILIAGVMLAAWLVEAGHRRLRLGA